MFQERQKRFEAKSEDLTRFNEICARARAPCFFFFFCDEKMIREETIYDISLLRVHFQRIPSGIHIFQLLQRRFQRKQKKINENDLFDPKFLRTINRGLVVCSSRGV